MEIATFAKFFAGAVPYMFMHLFCAANPFYLPADRVFEPSLLGRYGPARPALSSGEAASARESVEFKRWGARGYMVVMRRRDEEVEFEGTLFRLGAGRLAYFLDLTPAPGSESYYRFRGRAHLAARVSWEDGILRLSGASDELILGSTPPRTPTPELRRRLVRTTARGFGSSAELYRM